MSYWSAHHGGVGAALAGMDMSMPGDISFDSGTSYYGTNLTFGVLNGTIPQWRVDDMAVRIMAAYYKVGRDRLWTVPTSARGLAMNTASSTSSLLRALMSVLMSSSMCSVTMPA
ncbi:uncharacterized protein BDW70DRAFT_131520 [Aspergillus foveolatus]|uniref:uncharacterized protein n=1 Tax=Aspergillus foveolatus TaxID=210207 RepID=UPI003CCCC571